MIKTIQGFCNVTLLGLLLLDQFGAYGEEMVRNSKLFHRPVSCSTSRLIIIPRVDYSLLSRPTRKNVIEAGQLWKVQMSVLDQKVIYYVNDPSISLIDFEVTTEQEAFEWIKQFESGPENNPVVMWQISTAKGQQCRLSVQIICTHICTCRCSSKH